MSRKISAYIAMLLVAGAVACNDEDLPKSVNHYDGVVRPVGDAVGAPESFDVGPQGAIIKSADGTIEVRIPEGAVSEAITIGIQRVKNTAPQGHRNSYRLTPHDITFSKPVIISFTYDPLRVSFPDGLGIAYHGDDGIWYWPGNAEHDRGASKLTVESTHFSDWSLFESMYLTPSETIVWPDGDVEIVASRVLPPDMDEHLLAPLVLPEPVPLAESRPLENNYIKEWKLIGDGTLTPSGNTSVYVAPSEIPEDNPVTITLEVNLYNGSKAFLLSNVTVAGCEVTLNGGPYSNITFRSNESAMPVYIAEEDLNIITFYGEANGNEVLVYVFYPGKEPGYVTWTKETCYVSTHHAITESRVVQGGHWLDDDPVIVHPGFVEIYEYNEEAGIISGRFGGNFSFVEVCVPENCVYHGTIEGTFVASMY